MAKTPAQKLVSKHKKLIHSENMKIVSHVQRQQDEWWQHTLMIQGYDVPFKYKRKQAYQSLKGARVNITYYASSEDVAGMSFELMKVVRLKRS